MDFEQALSWWSFVFLGYVIWELGQRIKASVRALPETNRFRRVFDKTVWSHSTIVGALATLIPGFPLPDGIPTTVASKVLFGMVCGLTAAITHNRVRAYQKRVGNSEPSGDSNAG